MSETIGSSHSLRASAPLSQRQVFALLNWFVAVYTGVRPRRLLWTLTGVFAIVAFARIVAPGLVINVADGVGSTTPPWGETVFMVREGSAPLEVLLLVVLLVSIVYIFVADVKQFRQGDRGEAIVLAIGIGWFAFTIVEESLVSFGVIDFVTLSDFGFFGFVIAMGLEMVNRAIDTESELTDYKDNLEKMVEERSAQLEEAQHQLLLQAEEEATAAERSRLARELHDVITKLVFSIDLVAGSLTRLWRKDPEMAQRSTQELLRLTSSALGDEDAPVGITHRRSRRHTSRR
jgi:signal transduction histidine kinase